MARRVIELVDSPCFGRPTRVQWRKRAYRNRDNYRLRMLLIGGGLIHPRMS